MIIALFVVTDSVMYYEATCENCGKEGECTSVSKVTLCNSCCSSLAVKCGTCGGTGEIYTPGIGPFGNPVEKVDPCSCSGGLVVPTETLKKLS